MTHRWFTSVLHGRWCSGAEEALFDALRAGQAVRTLDGEHAVVLQTFAAIEAREPRSGPRVH